MDLSRIANVREHVTSDLVIGVECGISLTELKNLLKDRGQMFAASDSDGLLIDLLRQGDGGPFESGYGFLRSNILGLEFFDKNGDLIKCGGRVVKNVTGYDTTKLFVGTSAYGLAVMAYLRLFALPQKTVGLIVSGQNLVSLLQFSHKLIVSALPFSSLEIVSTRACDGYQLFLVLSGASSMVDDLCVAARDLAKGEGISFSEGEPESLSINSYGRIELACSVALLKRLSASFDARLGRVSIRPTQGRLTISCVSKEQLLLCGTTIKQLLLADLADKSIVKSTMETYSYSVRVGGVLLDVVELDLAGVKRQSILEALQSGISTPLYHPYKKGLFV